MQLMHLSVSNFMSTRSTFVVVKEAKTDKVTLDKVLQIVFNILKGDMSRIWNSVDKYHT